MAGCQHHQGVLSYGVSFYQGKGRSPESRPKTVRRRRAVTGEIKEQTGETLRTLRTWCNLGDWENLREELATTELDRLENLRDNLLGKAEAQLKEGKLPHAEIGLMYRLEKLIVQRKKDEIMVRIVALNTVMYFVQYLIKYDQKTCP